MLTIDGVSKLYRPAPALLRLLATSAAREPVVALEDVSFSVAPGEVVGLVGPNGAGKTTLIKTVATLLEPTRGRVLVDGFDTRTAARQVQRRLGLVLADDRALYWRLTGRRNLEFFGVMAGLSRARARQRADVLLERFDLAGRDKRVFGYSSGMRTRLSMARALMADPPLIVMDEPTRSLDPLVSADVHDLLRRLAGEGRAILLSSHRLDEVASVCDRVVVVVGGSVRYVGRTDALTADGDTTAARIASLLREEALQP